MPNVKTAISIPEKLFKEVERYSKRRKISRSEVFASAVKQLLTREAAQEITRKLNDVYAGDSQNDPESENWLRLTSAAMWDQVKDDKW